VSARAWLSFGAFASAVIAPSDHVARIQLKGSLPHAAGGGRESPHCSRVPCAQCLGVAVRRGRPWNGDWAVVNDEGEAGMLACAQHWLHNATRTGAAACAFIAADDADVLQRWVTSLARDGAHAAHTPGSDGSHTGTQHRSRAGPPSPSAVQRSYRDWFALACCSRDALLSDKSSFGCVPRAFLQCVFVTSGAGTAPSPWPCSAGCATVQSTSCRSRSRRRRSAACASCGRATYAQRHRRFNRK
jgi:hypothetical protein